MAQHAHCLYRHTPTGKRHGRKSLDGLTYVWSKPSGSKIGSQPKSVAPLASTMRPCRRSTAPHSAKAVAGALRVHRRASFLSGRGGRTEDGTTAAWVLPVSGRRTPAASHRARCSTRRCTARTPSVHPTRTQNTSPRALSGSASPYRPPQVDCLAGRGESGRVGAWEPPAPRVCALSSKPASSLGRSRGPRFLRNHFM